MSYYFTTTLQGPSFGQAIDTVTDALKEKGFGIMTTIDVKQAMKDKLDKDFRPYTILGACNPNYAYRALGEENKMEPCCRATWSFRKTTTAASRSRPSTRSRPWPPSTIRPWAKSPRKFRAC